MLPGCSLSAAESCSSCSCPSPAISIPTGTHAHIHAHAAHAAHAVPNRILLSSTFPPFAPSRIAWMNQATLAIPPFPCANPALNNADTPGDAHSDPCLPPNACVCVSTLLTHCAHLPADWDDSGVDV